MGSNVASRCGAGGKIEIEGGADWGDAGVTGPRVGSNAEEGVEEFWVAGEAVGSEIGSGCAGSAIGEVIADSDGRGACVLRDRKIDVIDDVVLYDNIADSAAGYFDSGCLIGGRP